MTRFVIYWKNVQFLTYVLYIFFQIPTFKGGKRTFFIFLNSLKNAFHADFFKTKIALDGVNYAKKILAE